MPNPITNPYADCGRWLKGAIHIHGREASNGATGGYDNVHGASLETIHEASTSAPWNFDFACVSIQVYKDGIGLFAATPGNDEVIYYPGREIQNNCIDDGDYREGYFQCDGSKYLHVLTIGENDGLSICAHPLYYQYGCPEQGGGWEDIKRALCNPDEPLKQLNVRGLEVYNGFTMKGAKDSRYPDGDFEEHCWDDMLKAGHHYLGFAANDEYYSDDYQFKHFKPLGYIQASPRERTGEAVMDALKRGCFYSSTGVELADKPLAIDNANGGTEFRAHAAKPVNWTASVYEKSNGGWALNQRSGSGESWTFSLKDDWKYARIQAQDPHRPLQRAWLQPILGPCWEATA